jgi:hypothetical protein
MEDILPFFRTHPQVAMLLAPQNPQAVAWDRLGLEVELLGSHRADLIAGDWQHRAYCLVEFEDAKPSSVFLRGKRGGELSARFSHGFNQIVDWFHLVRDHEKTNLVADQFGEGQIDLAGILVIGRDYDLNISQLRRLQWRQRHILVDSRHIYCHTYDGLLRDLQSRVATLELLYAALH